MNKPKYENGENEKSDHPTDFAHLKYEVGDWKQKAIAMHNKSWGVCPNCADGTLGKFESYYYHDGCPMCNGEGNLSEYDLLSYLGLAIDD